jgi:diacylglycerol kinase family enzyme
MAEDDSRKVLVLINQRSGLPKSFATMQRALDRYWDRPGTDLTYQFSQSPEDGRDKALRAVDRGAHTVLAVGGDGTVNTIGRALAGTPAALGVVPTGSGNGFARHFGIPLTPARAVEALAGSTAQVIDMGYADDNPFLVTCSMAWDAALVRSFEKSPVRGIVPYVFAGVYELFDYEPQDIRVELDGHTRLAFKEPMVFTIANLTQYGGGARIAPQARPDDGQLELVVALRQDTPKLLANIGRLFDGSVAELPEVVSRRFCRMKVRREWAAPIQIDGELIDAGAEVEVGVLPAVLNVLVPRAQPS